MKYLITESQLFLINESLPIPIRRRLIFDDLITQVNSIMTYELNRNSFFNVGDFISEVCDILVYNFIENNVDLTLSPSDKDKLYYYFVDLFKSQIISYYKDK